MNDFENKKQKQKKTSYRDTRATMLMEADPKI